MPSILETLRAPRPDGAFGPEDKLRLVLVFYLSSPDNAISKDDIAELEKELKNAGADTAAFEYVRRTREISRMTVSAAVGGTSTPVLGGQGELLRNFTALGNKVRAFFWRRSPCRLTSWLFTAYRPSERRWLGKPDFRREEFPASKQTVTCDATR